MANALKENFIFVEFAGIQKMPMCLSAFFAFFYAGAHNVNYMFFCLDAKEPKNQGSDALLTICLFFIWCS
ncbi:hypothetical protein BMF97_08490 [Elizabethkingia meningoseptica]|uniref:Uncharacterized protein n=1 Tax=Elizabethkingia meningoseptica TaxID=238 RepID=A0A1T3FLU9_ELIME|nr:hypothetical protein BMF97_08490 [Elizabethkingia meningoseptica]OPB78602.1 hypothetical protein BAY31_17835 [Elizabethkingia meningoseptica]